MYQLSDFLGAVSQDLFALGIALALGALIGLQRGWLARDKAAGQRVAGIRTHALLGLLGGLSVQLGRELGNWVPAILLVMVALAGLAGFLMQNRQQQDFSITSWVGQVLTFCFGALVVAGQPVIAAAAAVVTATILDNKESIHRFLKTLEANELDAGLKLLLISVVVLPLLPNEGLGRAMYSIPEKSGGWWCSSLQLVSSVILLCVSVVRHAVSCLPACLQVSAHQLR